MALDLVISGVSNLEQNNVILIISYPDIADIITKQLGLLKDPIQMGLSSYILETTKPGQLINQLIPGNGETLLNFKISLLQTALSKKATLLEMPAEDLMPMVELLHHISMREALHTTYITSTVLILWKSDQNFLALIRFLALIATTNHLLKNLMANGTLFIKNIEYLDRESKNIWLNLFNMAIIVSYKSEHKIASSMFVLFVPPINNCQNWSKKVHFLKHFLMNLKNAAFVCHHLMTCPTVN